MKIVWTLIAKKSYNKNIQYLEEYWTTEIVKDFILEVEKTMKIISENPYCFQDWEFDPSYKKGFIHKNVSFYYKIHSEEIVVYLFWNNYQSPEKLKFQLLNS
jgi:plasmid stabilization system protein ParE